MNTIKLYKNPNPYPFYGELGNPIKTIQASPRNQDLKTGYIDMQLNFDTVLSFNYLSITRDGKNLYAWVENVEEVSGDRLYRVHYNIDPFRTYRSDLVYGNQYIERSPTPTLLYDPLLGSTKETNDIDFTTYSIGSAGKRYAVVQDRVLPQEVYSNTPVQPTPYRFFVCEYNVNDWTSSQPILNLMMALANRGESSNIVTLYSIPYIKIADLEPQSIMVHVPGQESKTISGWRKIPHSRPVTNVLTNFTPLTIPSNLTKTKHSVMLVFPEAGIINIPDELLNVEGLGVRQDVDLFSGACNYMLASHSGNRPYHLSVRGGSTSSIPILSDPYDTYISQNQNALITSLMGDVASVGMGAINFAGGNPGGLASLGQGISSLITKGASLADAESKGFSNPPAFLGTALAPSFHQKFWQITIKTHVDNESYVRANYGYPCERVQPLTIPSSGFIKTQNCNLSSNGNVPLWAIRDINTIFDNGILFK